MKFRTPDPKDSTINHIKKLAFNRNASSEGEEKALNYLKDQLEKGGIDFNEDHFKWSSLLTWLMRLVYALIIIYLLIFQQILLIIAFFLFKNMFSKTREFSFTYKEESRNLEVTIPARKKQENRPVIIFTAHYDSVSGILPYKVQLFFFPFYKIITVIYIGFLGFLMGWAILLIFSIIPYIWLLPTMIIIATFLGLIISLPLLLIIFSDKPSEGSIDNASGVSILLELAKIIKENPLENIDVKFLWTSAEEWGMKGSKHYSRTYFQELNEKYDLNNSMNINIDMVGSYIGLLEETGLFKTSINYSLNNILERSANELGVPIEKYSKLRAPQSDYKAFETFTHKTQGGFQVACFHSDKDSKYIHSTQDSPDKCSSEILNGCVYICDRGIRILDQKYYID